MSEIIHPQNDGFKERIEPKTASDSVGVFFHECCGCKSVHFRHAGYIQSLVPFMRAGGEKRINLESLQVMVCVKCRKSFVWLNEQMYDVTDKVDITAWESFEKEAHKATGPGGQC